MEPITRDEIQRFAPRAKEAYIDALIDGWTDIVKAEINTELRLCEFLAQVGHETGGLTIIRENTNWTPEQMCRLWPHRFKTKLDPRIVACGKDPAKKAELAYGHKTRPDLGNKPGEAYQFRGACWMQDTGRACLEEYGNITGLDLVGNPELLDRPSVMLKVATARWKKMGLNRFADRHYTRAIGNAINRGSAYSSKDPIGHVEKDKTGRVIGGRLYWFERAWAVFGHGEVEVPAGMALGAHGATVERLQVRLKELGYGVGGTDKVFGPTLARAVAAFKLDHKRRTGEALEPDEVVGPLTEAALQIAPQIEVSPDRAAATEKDLLAAGSEETKAAENMKRVGTAVAVGGAAVGAETTGATSAAVPAIKETIGWVPEAQSALMPVIEAVRWGAKHAGWVLVIGAGVWFYAKGRHVLAARLKAHRLGFNLFR